MARDNIAFWLRMAQMHLESASVGHAPDYACIRSVEFEMEQARLALVTAHSLAMTAESEARGPISDAANELYQELKERGYYGQELGQ